MSDQNANSNRKRKVRALLAGGLVLGVGAAITLAAWTDNVFGNADFATGDDQWNIQARFEAVSAGPTSPWVEADVTPGGTFGFPAPRLDLTPGDSVYAPIALRLEPGQDLNAAVTLLGATGGLTSPELAGALVYTVTVGGTPETCAAGAPTGTALFTDQALDVGSATDAITLLATAVPVNLCFEVSLPDGTSNDLSGLATGQVVWEFEGESVTPPAVP